MKQHWKHLRSPLFVLIIRRVENSYPAFFAVCELFRLWKISRNQILLRLNLIERATLTWLDFDSNFEVFEEKTVVELPHRSVVFIGNHSRKLFRSMRQKLLVSFSSKTWARHHPQSRAEKVRSIVKLAVCDKEASNPLSSHSCLYLLEELFWNDAKIGFPFAQSSRIARVSGISFLQRFRTSSDYTWNPSVARNFSTAHEALKSL